MKIPLARSIPSISQSVLREHLSSPHHTPLHLPNLLTSWPGLDSWRLSDGLERLRQILGQDRQVEVELVNRGRGYLDPEFNRVHMPFGTFLDTFILGRVPSSTDSALLPTAYLAQMDLSDTGDLQIDVPPLKHFEAGPKNTIYRRTLWVGPDESFTPFHKDPYIGLYSQVIGKKTFFVVPPEGATSLEPSTIPRYTNTSTLPIPVSQIFPSSSESRSPDEIPPHTLERYRSQFERAFALDGACRVDLVAGDSVLVPQGWWHSAEGVNGPGVGVGAWFR